MFSLPRDGSSGFASALKSWRTAAHMRGSACRRRIGPLSSFSSRNRPCPQVGVRVVQLRQARWAARRADAQNHGMAQRAAQRRRSALPLGASRKRGYAGAQRVEGDAAQMSKITSAISSSPPITLDDDISRRPPPTRFWAAVQPDLAHWVMSCRLQQWPAHVADKGQACGCRAS